MLSSLEKAGIIMHIATNKRIFPTNKILNYFGWTPFFKTINVLDSTAIKFSSKAEILGAVITNENLNLDSTIYVGDIFADFLAAQQNKINFIYAKWGYGQNEAFDYPVASANVDELIAKILN
jgi:phosphoglycolate phosphatase